MPRTRIKFCGITRPEDALLAAQLGADAVGMVLHANSPRRIDRETARKILSVLPPFVTPVGLFVDADAKMLTEIVADLRLRHVQLHGQETPQMTENLRGLAIIKAVRVTPAKLAVELNAWRDVSTLAGLLLETGGTSQPGGTGVVNDWQLIHSHQHAGDFDGLPPIIAAGGLTSENVAEVIRLLNPWAVDVSSGIESTPGIKSREKMESFVRAVQGATQG